MREAVGKAYQTGAGMLKAAAQTPIGVLKRPSPFARALLGSPVLPVAILLTACAIPISYYDVTTYKNLTDLKVEMATLVESFDSKSVAANAKEIEAVTLAFRKAFEYERGKGDPNSDTVQQFEKIRKLFEDDVHEYRTTRPGELGRKYFQEAAETLGQAFDIVIATENEKNRDKH